MTDDVNENILIFWYDYHKGWTFTNPYWHEQVIRNVDIDKHLEMVEWIVNNIDGYKKHCRWNKINEKSIFRFRHGKDFMWFNLTWR